MVFLPTPTSNKNKSQATSTKFKREGSSQSQSKALAPPIKLIPPVAKKKVDFQNHLLLNGVELELLCLGEPHNSSENPGNLVSPHGVCGGGLALFWKTDLQLDVTFSSSNVIDTSLASARLEPWFLTGDFNEFTDNSEKFGGPLRPESSFSNFKSFLASNDLYGLRHSGNSLSWRGKRHEHLILCRLDIALSNSEWAATYPASRCEYLRFEGADHIPVISWSNQRDSYITSKLEACRWSISQWNKNHPLNSLKSIEEAKQSLDDAMSSPVAADQTILQIKEKLQQLYRDEESYWKQRSRQLWLALGDKNMGYFHAATKGRRAINKFSVMEDVSEKVVFEETEITSSITSYYSSLFTTEQVSGSNHHNIIDKGISKSISPEKSLQLTEIPRAEEVKKAIFDINGTKVPGPDGFPSSFYHSFWDITGPSNCALQCVLQGDSKNPHKTAPACVGILDR